MANCSEPALTGNHEPAATVKVFVIPSGFSRQAICSHISSTWISRGYPNESRADAKSQKEISIPKALGNGAPSVLV